MVTMRPEEGDDPSHDGEINEHGKEDQQYAQDTAFTEPAHGVLLPALLLRLLLDVSLLYTTRSMEISPSVLANAEIV
jgi:hypothetical protein